MVENIGGKCIGGLVPLKTCLAEKIDKLRIYTERNQDKRALAT